MKEEGVGPGVGEGGCVLLTSVSVSSDRSSIGTHAVVPSIRTRSSFSFPAEGTTSSKSGIPACRGGGSQRRRLARFYFVAVVVAAVALFL